MNQSMKYGVRFSLCAIVVLGGLALIGCNNPISPSSTPKQTSMKPGTSSTQALTSSSAATLTQAKSEAEAFLKTLCSGDVKAASAKVTVDFKKAFFTPFYPEEKQVGYSESDTQKYLQAMTKGLSNPTFRTQVLSPDGRQASFRGQLAGEKPAMFAIRLVKQGNDWLVNRFAVAGVLAYGVPKDDGNAELSWIRETALDFLESMIGSDEEHAMTMSEMTPAFKKRLPSPSIIDPELGYAKRDVRNWLNDQRKDVTGFVIGMQELDPKGRKFTGELTGAGKPKPFTLWVVQSDGKWLVENFEVQN